MIDFSTSGSRYAAAVSTDVTQQSGRSLIPSVSQAELTSEKLVGVAYLRLEVHVHFPAHRSRHLQKFHVIIAVVVQAECRRGAGQAVIADGGVAQGIDAELSGGEEQGDAVLHS